jgi:hypothetical protein
MCHTVIVRINRISFTSKRIRRNVCLYCTSLFVYICIVYVSCVTHSNNCRRCIFDLFADLILAPFYSLLRLTLSSADYDSGGRPPTKLQIVIESKSDAHTIQVSGICYNLLDCT